MTPHLLWHMHHSPPQGFVPRGQATHKTQPSHFTLLRAVLRCWRGTGELLICVEQHIQTGPVSTQPPSSSSVGHQIFVFSLFADVSRCNCWIGWLKSNSTGSSRLCCWISLKKEWDDVYQKKSFLRYGFLNLDHVKNPEDKLTCVHIYYLNEESFTFLKL